MKDVKKMRDVKFCMHYIEEAVQIVQTVQMAMENVTTGQSLRGWAGPVERKLRIDLLIRGNLGSYSFVFVKTYY